ncbi:DUF3581 family protein [Aliikangiella coralliicola]|uniref:DUF3581 family protein n=1 Tax=Aliikangiella coralliicola TaxID=2592383 RepID=A0A545U614_9GAMM|nr:DUF3581 family protein [Aliikangiella coralliicola]TQV84911.1 DUF3581 family protein [Aliikangiella coralliicola]
MFVEGFYSQSGESFSFTREQGSEFAKKIAGDYNPLHHPDNKRFCVPGDLLFALTLSQFGVSQSMTFDFQGMVSGDTSVHFVENENQISVQNEKEKTYLTAAREGEITRNEGFVEALIRSYVAFSGKTFPHILVELMNDEGVMINPEKPMVIYDMMKLTFDKFVDGKPEVVLQGSRFDVNGKRGMVIMNFNICADNEVIGSGEKHIIMSGLRPYEQVGIDLLVRSYEEDRVAFK